MPSIKGFAVRGLLRYLKATRPEAKERVITALPEPSRLAFDRPIVLSDWYDYRVFADLLREIDREIGNGDLRLCRDVGDFAARQDITGIFKMMLGILNPDTLLKRSTIFWSKYSDTGSFHHVPSGEYRYAVRLEDFPDMDEAHCWLMIGWMTRLGLISRARTVDMRHTECVSHGGKFCQWEGSWTEG
ncbi:MAG: hypothetical protein WBX15_13025 [Thermoanaerobaculia bacterium]